MVFNSNHKNHFKIIKTILSLQVIQKQAVGQLWQQAVVCWPLVYRIKSKSLIWNTDFSIHCPHLISPLIFPVILFRSLHSPRGLTKYVAQSSQSFKFAEWKMNVFLYTTQWTPCTSASSNLQFLIRRQLNDQDNQSCWNSTQFKSPQSLN